MRMLFAVGTTALLAGCTDHAAAELNAKCHAPFSGGVSIGWGVVSEFCHHCTMNQIRIERDGSIKWNGKAISIEKLDSYLGEVPKLVPQPMTDLDFDKGTPCKQLVAVRTVMNGD